ncbi:translocation/assembly module TamB domain-containing protein [Caulobacter soli]|uniref:translocation/assembly module TamB domain-containing protein n=1 Tax=Caulobacter soli TaxID=2708539 RepID=UPI0013EE2D3E|nr:translocation/assembly module TamB domain-containing protein [Caulobacter soli]
MPEAVAEAATKVARKIGWPGLIIIVSVSLVMLVAVLLGGVRLGAITPQGRAFLEARTSGLKIGRMGRLKIEGLTGDIWSAFGVRRLTISDEKGVWLDAADLYVDWRPAELFYRRFHADTISARQVVVLRRPTLTPKGKSSAAPLSVDLDKVALRLITRPEFSRQAGDFDLSGDYESQRLGGMKGNLQVLSRMHAGDHLKLVFDLGRDKTLLLDAVAREANGGALAGAMGLEPSRPFDLNAKAHGTFSQGAFTVLARSGDATPLKAGGAWTPQGGSATGHIDLAASTLTDREEQMFGADARFSIVGHKVGAFSDLDLKVDSQNLSLVAHGPADLGKRTTAPAGLTFSAKVGKLSRITAFPTMGAGAVDGIFHLTGDGFLIDGRVDVRDLSLLGYRLARAKGPATVGWKRGELNIKADATTEGGGGQGLLAVLGRSPSAQFEGARLKDGRFLIRSAKVQAPNLNIVAEGERGILGGLSFKGEAKVASLAPVHAGMAGQATAKWSVSQGVGKPWMLTMDARGGNFATGLAELDRLLGKTPRLNASASWANERLSVADAKLDGAATSMRSSGVLGPGAALAFKLDWTATGPFVAGPIEVSGKAKGTGAITGTLSTPKADLIADFDSIDVPRLPLKDAHVVLSFAKRTDGADGTASIEAGSQYGPAKGRAAFNFAPGGLELTDLDVDAGGAKAKGGVSLRSGRPATADLTVAIGPGAFLPQGRVSGTAKIADSAGGPVANLDLNVEDIVSGAWKVRHAAVKASGPMAHLPLTIDARGEAPSGRWNLKGSGVLTEAGEDYQLALDAAGAMARTEIKTRETAQIRFGGPRTAARLRLSVGDGSADLDADVGGDLATLRAQLTGVSLTAINPDMAGKVDGHLTLTGSGATLNGDFDANLIGARERGPRTDRALNAEIRGALRDNLMTISATSSNSQGLQAKAEVTLPTEASAKPFHLAIDRTRPVRGQFTAQGEIKPLWDLLGSSERSVSGKIDAEGDLAGTLADPRLTGRASLEGGRVDDGQTGLSLRDVIVRVALADNAIDVSQVSAGDGQGGSMSGSGRISLAREGLSSFKLDLKGFRVIDNELASATASGQTTVNRGADGKVKMVGALTIDRADVSAQTKTPAGVVSLDVIERNRPDELDQGIEARKVVPGSGMLLDVTLKAPRRIFVRGRGLDVELSLDAHVGGSTNSPQLDGEARMVRGEYDFAGKRFEFEETGTVRLATQLDRIRLDLTATREDPTLTAVVKVQGTAAKPEITLTSKPELPQDEVLSQVLFGSSAANLTPIEAAQLASALAALAGGGGFDVIGNLRSLAGLDRLSFADSATGMTVAGGKYVTDDVYVEIIGGGREGSSAQVEWRIRRALSLVSKIGSTGDTQLSVRWRKDYN